MPHRIHRYPESLNHERIAAVLPLPPHVLHAPITHSPHAWRFVALVWSCWLLNMDANERHLMLCAISTERSFVQFAGQHGDAVANRATFP